MSSKVILSNFGVFASPERSLVFGLNEAFLEAVKAGRIPAVGVFGPT